MFKNRLLHEKINFWIVFSNFYIFCHKLFKEVIKMKVTRNFLIIALLLSIVFTISAVAAAENATFEQSDMGEVSTETLNVPSDENQEIKAVDGESSVSSAEDEDFEMSDENDILEASNIGFFSDIQKKVDSAKDGDTIYLEGKTYVYDTTRPISFYGKNLRFVGGSSLNDGKYATLDALDSNSILNIYYTSGYSGPVILDSIIFCNSKNGAISANYGLIIKNCYFINNSGDRSALDFIDSDYDYGYGYIYNMPVYNLEVTDSYFINIF